MHIVDISIFIAYFLAMIGVGIYFLNRNKTSDDYYVGGRNMGAGHIGLSVVATDVGGGFSIGLGGLGFTMGLSGSWMLFTGLIGAWLSAVLLIPKVFELGKKTKMFTFPQVFGHLYGKDVALLAGLISMIGYLGFTSSQMLAGAKLASATFDELNLQYALILMGIIIVVYTVFGGLKAVIYTDTIQWIILLAGLILIGIPIAYFEIGGMAAITGAIKPEMMTLTNLSWQDLVNWGVTIIPIWFVGMTLYQRIYACRDAKTARKAWFVAGLFEWPIMAFMGVLLGLFARLAADQGMFEGIHDPTNMDAEMGLPLLLKNILPVGMMGLMMSAYFSAIMSTADSCLMAASGNMMTDVLNRFLPQDHDNPLFVRRSQILTLVLGTGALMLALFMTNVLELMLYSYAFMVSGLLVPLVAGLILKKRSAPAALTSMLVGGSTTFTLMMLKEFADLKLPLGLDPNIYGLSAAAISYVILYQLFPNKKQTIT